MTDKIHQEWLNSWLNTLIVLGLAVLCILFFAAGKWILKLIASLPSEMRGFLALALFFVLLALGLIYQDDDTILRIYILFGAIGIMSVARGAARMLWPEEWNLVENKD